MIRQICECDLCSIEESFDPDSQARPKGWHSIYGLIDNGQEFTHVCPSCWKELVEFAEQIHARECYH